MRKEMNRRKFLKQSLLTMASVSAFASLIITPRKVFAAWPKDSFDITDLSKSISSVYGHDDLKESTKVKLKVPDIAENGAIVPINVKTKLDNVESIMVFVENNPQPLSSGYKFSSKAKPINSKKNTSVHARFIGIDIYTIYLIIMKRLPLYGTYFQQPFCSYQSLLV